MEVLGQERGQGSSSSPAVRVCCDLKREDPDFTELIALKRDKSVNTKVFNSQHTAQTRSWRGFGGMGLLQSGNSCLSSVWVNLGTFWTTASLVAPQRDLEGAERLL